MAIDFEDAFFKNYMGTMYPMEQEMAPDTQVASADTGVTTDVGGIAEIPRNKAQEALGYVGQLLTKAGVNLDEYGIDIPVLGRVTLKDLTVGESGRILEDMSYGFMPVTGTGLNTKLNPEVIDLLGLPGVGAAAKVAAKPVIKATEKLIKTLPQDLPVGMSIKMLDGTEQVLQKAPKVESKAFKNWFGDSKAVDDTGKPIVVYHATREQFDEFNTTGEGQSLNTGTFFSSSPDVAGTYNTSSEHSIVPAYLSLKNPVVIDANGANWNRIGQDAKISLPEIKVSAKEDEMLLSELTGQEPNMGAMTTLEKRDITAKELFGETVFEKGFSTNEIARWARTKGYDGVIFKNVVDHGPAVRFSTEQAEKPSNIYVAFQPTQIKSAISNKGTFDPKDPSILKGVGVGGTGAAMSQEENK